MSGGNAGEYAYTAVYDMYPERADRRRNGVAKNSAGRGTSRDALVIIAMY